MTDVKHMIFHRLGLIRVDILLPEHEDPGQVLYAQSALSNLIRAPGGRRDFFSRVVDRTA